ncbi:MAG: DUF6624 domain-containing protein, partial [Candidatus Paceibacterota bacterium]
MEINKKIKEQLTSMLERDQEMRQKAKNGEGEWDKRVDEENTKELKGILKEIGWPTISKVGAGASKAAWLLAQHADHDLDFQKECLGFIVEAVEKDEVERKQIGYLTDRILLKEGKKQLYGTQFRKN